jgi:recombination protein RecR
MSLLPKSLARVIESFEKLPGIGPKTAQRLAFYLLHMPEDEVERFADALSGLKNSTVLCSVCKNVTEVDPCPICSDPKRDRTTICIVEQPTDVIALERTNAYHGLYHILHGAIDPLNNIGPDEIYINDFITRIDSSVKEIIFAVNPTMEGEATIMYIMKQLSALRLPPSALKVTRLAHGLPIGSDIEYADEVTLRRAMEGRREW